ncbi:hypothetical protein BGW36DRAFT_433571 [Talaromyces proteolyticus]|uniref:Uncharacterized protein n=1 Tax=Talaromyces proteolyticus TaxID=1131652 RepID=A0AAD4PUM7_9EURO|nr:uncharacterized protein BGW36DRAFT_433571 [Talaromyces proteolyticus]KAH8689567.1 hypothetical protein BGW36DRAFT_433571 [Talaromyces proteolyticus]
MSDRNPQSAERSASAMEAIKARVAESMQPGDSKSTAHSLPPDERESILGLDNEEHGYNGARAKEKEESEEGEGSGQRQGMGMAEMMGGVVDRVAKAMGRK